MLRIAPNLKVLACLASACLFASAYAQLPSWPAPADTPNSIPIPADPYVAAALGFGFDPNSPTTFKFSPFISRQYDWDLKNSEGKPIPQSTQFRYEYSESEESFNSALSVAAELTARYTFVKGSASFALSRSQNRSASDYYVYITLNRNWGTQTLLDIDESNLTNQAVGRTTQPEIFAKLFGTHIITRRKMENRAIVEIRFSATSSSMSSSFQADVKYACRNPGFKLSAKVSVSSLANQALKTNNASVRAYVWGGSGLQEMGLAGLSADSTNLDSILSKVAEYFSANLNYNHAIATEYYATPYTAYCPSGTLPTIFSVDLLYKRFQQTSGDLERAQNIVNQPQDYAWVPDDKMDYLKSIIPALRKRAKDLYAYGQKAVLRPELIGNTETPPEVIRVKWPTVPMVKEWNPEPGVALRLTLYNVKEAQLVAVDKLYDWSPGWRRLNDVSSDADRLANKRVFEVPSDWLAEYVHDASGGLASGLLLILLDGGTTSMFPDPNGGRWSSFRLTPP